MDLWHKDPADQNIWYEFDWSANDSGGNIAQTGSSS